MYSKEPPGPGKLSPDEMIMLGGRDPNGRIPAMDPSEREVTLQEQMDMLKARMAATPDTSENRIYPTFDQNARPVTDDLAAAGLIFPPGWKPSEPPDDLDQYVAGLTPMEQHMLALTAACDNWQISQVAANPPVFLAPPCCEEACVEDATRIFWHLEAEDSKGKGEHSKVGGWFFCAKHLGEKLARMGVV